MQVELTMQFSTVEASKADLASLLLRIAKGEEVLIAEKKKPIARLVPIPAAPSLKDLPKILSGIEHHLTKEEADDFARDIEEARRLLNATPIRDPWES